MAQVEQAVILAAGRGTRLQKADPSVTLDPATEAIVRQGIKALVPIGGRPYLDYSLDRLMSAGIRRICLVIAPGSAPLHAYVHGLPDRFPGIHAECVEQPEPRGTAHALRFARAATGSRDFIMLNSDNLYPVNALRALAELPPGACGTVGFDREGLLAHSNFDAGRVSKLGVLVSRPDDPDIMDRVVEKPDDPAQFMRNGKLWITMNVWRFPPAIYDFCDSVSLSERGEYELTSAVQDLSNSGVPVHMLRSSEGVLDLTSRSDILHLEKILCA